MGASITTELTLSDGTAIRAVWTAPAGHGSVRLEKPGEEGGSYLSAYTSAASGWEFKYQPPDEGRRKMWTEAVRAHVAEHPELIGELKRLNLLEDVNKALAEAARYAKLRRNSLRDARVARVKIRELGLAAKPAEPGAAAEPEKVPA